MTAKLTRTEKARRLDAFLSNDDNFEAVAYNDPRAVALRAKSAKLNAKKAAVRAARAVETAALASTFFIGQSVRTARNEIGAVTAIDGQNVSVSVAGTVRKFNASFLKVA